MKTARSFWTSLVVSGLLAATPMAATVSAKTVSPHTVQHRVAGTHAAKPSAKRVAVKAVQKAPTKAALVKTNALAHGHVRALIGGKQYDAIAVGDTTYVALSGMAAMKTPYEDLGGGKIAVTGGYVQGVVYGGTTYVPWQKLAAKVKATPLKGGGFTFSSLPVNHHYQIEIDTQNTTVGSPAPLQIATLDGLNPVPNQNNTITTTGFSTLTPSSGSTTLHTATDYSGMWFNGVEDNTAETAYVTVSWVDPAGKTVQQTAAVKFAPAASSQTATPQATGETLLASVPITTFQNGVFFNASSGKDNLTLQLDTGAYEPLFTAADAKLLHLPNLGSIAVSGIGGQDQAYMSEVSLDIGGQHFADIPCIVDPSYTGISLLGFGFFQANGYDLFVSQKYNMLSIFH
ncbi:hypothetical protein SD51_04425 [Alicyclobacillus tengchongensis]|nr:hypothetical protein SD51_04425 [Alicyclobacillus tengchongensis]